MSAPIGMLVLAAALTQGAPGPFPAAAQTNAGVDKRPFAKLFSAEAAATPEREELKKAAQQAGKRSARAAAKVVCGMVVLEPDPTLDPGFVKRIDPDTAASAKIRKIAPPACEG